MSISENQLFHGRYRLVELIGRGASAEVWKAIDTKAGNMPVALKIYKPEVLGAGSAGIAEFQREFTMVYNMTHTNLLHPQGFDISDGSPYLVMAYCENGSATSMTGRCDKEDILRFLRDVAAGLEYLHDHNITHQDIKPDNILLDDNCNFMVTDFGISRRDQGDAIGGTRAYMAPEVYRGKPTHASDIWSLGATAVELINGEPPYGELGGAAQTQNPTLPKLKGKLGENLPKLIGRMLDPDPRKRPSAAAIRSQIDHYRETGSWNRQSQRNKMAYIAAAIFSAIVVAGLIIWDVNRTKVRYYKDYTCVWGVPQGFGPVSPLDQKHREYTFKFEYKGGKLRHLIRVNGHGNVTIPNESESNERFTEAEFYYSNDDKIDYIREFNQGGECIHVMDFDSNLRNITFKSDDEHPMEKPLLGKTSETVIAVNDNEKNASPITRYLVDYDDEGRYKRIAYATFKNIKVTDEDMIHGKIYEYDDRGRTSSVTTIGLDGEPRGNSRGLATRNYKWDDNDNLLSVDYLTVDGSPSDDGSGCPRFVLEFDKYGNKIAERYFTLDNEPMLRTNEEISVHGIQYERDKHGNVIAMTYIGLDDEPTTALNSVKTVRYKYNDLGYLAEMTFFDENDELYNALSGNDIYAGLEYQSNDRGIVTFVRFFDADRNPVELSSDYSAIRFKLDDAGRTIEESYLNNDSALVNANGFYAQTKYAFDNMGQMIRLENFDAEGNPAINSNGVSSIEYEYDENCFLTKIAFFGKDGKPCLSNALYSYATFTYDTSRGNRTSVSYFDAKGNKTGGSDGIHRIEYVHHPQTNANTALKYYNAAGKLTEAYEYKYDDRGNIIEEKEVGENGALKNGTAIINAEYDSNNRQTRLWHTNAAGQRVILPGDKYCESRRKFDDRGNIIEESFFSPSGAPALCNAGVSKIVKEYNSLNKVVHWLNYDTAGNTIKNSEDNAPEAKFEYDGRGNQTLIAIFDGHGRPFNSMKNWQRAEYKYDNRNRLIELAYFDKDGRPVKEKNDNFTRMTKEYDAHNNETKVTYYDHDKIYIVVSNKYNTHDRLTEATYLDGNGRKVNDFPFTKVTIEYESDDVTPKKQNFYDGSKLIAWRTWNKEKGEYNDYQFAAGYGNTGGYSSYGGGSSYGGSYNWQQEYRETAAQCPMTLDDGETQIYSISVGGDYLQVTVKLLTTSKYDIDEEEMSSLRSSMNNLRRGISSELPGYVDVYINLIDRANRRIDL